MSYVLVVLRIKNSEEALLKTGVNCAKVTFLTHEVLKNQKMNQAQLRELFGHMGECTVQ